MCNKQECLWFETGSSSCDGNTTSYRFVLLMHQIQKGVEMKGDSSLWRWWSEQEDALESPLKRDKCLGGRWGWDSCIAWKICLTNLKQRSGQRTVIGLMNYCFLWWTLPLATFALSNSWVRTISKTLKSPEFDLKKLINFSCKNLLLCINLFNQLNNFETVLSIC